MVLVLTERLLQEVETAALSQGLASRLPPVPPTVLQPAPGTSPSFSFLGLLNPLLPRNRELQQEELLCGF